MEITAMDLVNLLDDAGLTARSYSGRGMFGELCVSAVVPPEEVMTVGAILAAELIQQDEDKIELLPDLMRGTAVDDMGLDKVVYWPAARWPEGRKDTPTDHEDADAN